MATTLRTWSGLISALLAGSDLTAADTAWAMDQLVLGDASPAQISGFLIALRAKGETAGEIAGLASVLRSHATPVRIPGPFVDIVGTGGDRTGAVNISTMAAVVAASTGVTVVKHGGRAASSSAGGSADLVEHLGVPLDLSADEAVRVADEVGLTYLFAPRFNRALRHVAVVRRELAVPTAFNVLAPLLNPADPQHQLVGVANPRMLPVIARRAGCRRPVRTGRAWRRRARQADHHRAVALVGGVRRLCVGGGVRPAVPRVGAGVVGRAAWR